MLRELCIKHTELTEEEIAALEELNSALSYFTGLSDADIFIDCFERGDKKAVVVAHSRPDTNSLYNRNIEGEYVYPQNEPIVFYTKKTGITMSEGKAVSQENKVVMKKTVPVLHNDKVIAVLIKETDVTKNYEKNQHIEKVEKESELLGNLIMELKNTEKEIFEKNILIQELHHRTKNDLQTICSIMSMQARRVESDEAKRVLYENINRLKSMAEFHTVTMSAASGMISLNELLEKIVSNINEYTDALGKSIEIRLSGDEIRIDSEKAQSIVLAVNEALTNAIKHGYATMDEGTIEVVLSEKGGVLEIKVEDNGQGFCTDEGRLSRPSMGMKLMELLIEDKLGGRVIICSSPDGTDVKMQIG